MAPTGTPPAQARGKRSSSASHGQSSQLGKGDHAEGMNLEDWSDTHFDNMSDPFPDSPFPQLPFSPGHGYSGSPVGSPFGSPGPSPNPAPRPRLVSQHSPRGSLRPLSIDPPTPTPAGRSGRSRDSSESQQSFLYPNDFDALDDCPDVADGFPDCEQRISVPPLDRSHQSPVLGSQNFDLRRGLDLLVSLRAESYVG